MLGIGFALAVQSHLIRPSISVTTSSCSHVASFRCRTDDALFWFSMIVLLIPKMLGLFTQSRRDASAGAAA